MSSGMYTVPLPGPRRDLRIGSRISRKESGWLERFHSGLLRHSALLAKTAPRNIFDGLTCKLYGSYSSSRRLQSSSCSAVKRTGGRETLHRSIVGCNSSAIVVDKPHSLAGPACTDYTPADQPPLASPAPVANAPHHNLHRLQIPTEHIPNQPQNVLCIIRPVRIVYNPAAPAFTRYRATNTPTPGRFPSQKLNASARIRSSIRKL